MAGKQAANGDQWRNLTEERAGHLEQYFRTFLKRQERVLLCLPRHGEGDMSAVLARELRRAECIPMSCGADYRWKALLRQAFVSGATVVVGLPLVLLGLAKLARAEKVPLYIRNAILVGAPCQPWIAEDIRHGLDCQTWEWDIPGRDWEHPDCGDPDVERLFHSLLRWTSILDCRVRKSRYGLEMELVVFPGEKLPKLPTCARQVVRRWDPERDMPFVLAQVEDNPVFFGDSH